jgi:hypothetical protein
MLSAAKQPYKAKHSIINYIGEKKSMQNNNLIKYKVFRLKDAL